MCIRRSDSTKKICKIRIVPVLETGNAERLDDFPTRESGRCVFCRYFELCPAKRHKRLLEETSEDSSTESVVSRASALADKLVAAKRSKQEATNTFDQLKVDAQELAKEFDMNKFEGEQGRVSISTRRSEKFINKTSSIPAEADFVPSLFHRWTNMNRILIFSALHAKSFRSKISFHCK